MSNSTINQAGPGYSLVFVPDNILATLSHPMYANNLRTCLTNWFTTWVQDPEMTPNPVDFNANARLYALLDSFLGQVHVQLESSEEEN